jgi:hypothetical protein
MIEGWGMSETCAIGTNNPVNASSFTGSIGLPLPGIDIAIKDDDGNSLAPASREICIRGPNVMPGYYNQPEENAATFTADGFMRTGDIGIMDEGYTRIIDRKKDMILVSGFNVYPNELEQVVSVPRRARMRGRGRARRGPGRGHQGLRRAQRPGPDRGRGGAPLPRPADRLQAPPVHRVPRRAAQDQCGQDLRRELRPRLKFYYLFNS